MRNAVPVFVMAVLLAGCGSYAPEGSSPEYASAYNDGCRSGYQQGGRGDYSAPPRNNESYATNVEYREGWDAGFNECFDRAISQPYGEGGSGNTPR